MRVIHESDMDFIIPDDSNLFHIEQSQILQSLKGGVRTVEFIYLYPDDNMMLVEAKKSCPNANNAGESKEKKEKFEQFFLELTEKYTHSVSLFTSAAVGRRIDTGEIGSKLTIDQFKNCRLKFLLVIKTAEEEWLVPVKAELEQRLKAIRKIWSADIIVLNESMAKSKHIIKG